MSAQKITVQQTRWPKHKEVKELGSNTLYFSLKAARGAATDTKEWKYSTLILVPLPIPATKKEITRLHKESLGQGSRGATAPGKP